MKRLKTTADLAAILLERAHQAGFTRARRPIIVVSDQRGPCNWEVIAFPGVGPFVVPKMVQRIIRDLQHDFDAQT